MLIQSSPINLQARRKPPTTQTFGKVTCIKTPWIPSNTDNIGGKLKEIGNDLSNLIHRANPSAEIRSADLTTTSLLNFTQVETPSPIYVLKDTIGAKIFIVAGESIQGLTATFRGIAKAITLEDTNSGTTSREKMDEICWKHLKPFLEIETRQTIDLDPKTSFSEKYTIKPQPDGDIAIRPILGNAVSLTQGDKPLQPPARGRGSLRVVK